MDALAITTATVIESALSVPRPLASTEGGGSDVVVHSIAMPFYECMGGYMGM